MIVNLSRLHHPVTTLGPGRRAGIWMQGCSLACPGCVSRDTWNPLAGNSVEVDAVIGWLTDLCRVESLDGITISGGEPTEQPQALHALAVGIDGLRRKGMFDGDLLCYTGVEEHAFHDRCPWAVPLVDAVITGAFDITRPTTALWRGSANQRLLTLTPRGAEVYDRQTETVGEQPGMQVTVADERIWMIGIPRRGDMNRLEAALRAQGVTMEDVSWRP